jgi:hypothetical protein
VLSAALQHPTSLPVKSSTHPNSPQPPDGPGGADAERRRLEEQLGASERDGFDCGDCEKLALSIVVLGASGDLAKKKTYPALFALFAQGWAARRRVLRRRLLRRPAPGCCGAHRALGASALSPDRRARGAAAGAASSLPQQQAPTAVPTAPRPPPPGTPMPRSFLPKRLQIVGYARSALSDGELREQQVRPHLRGEPALVEGFLACCTYLQGEVGASGGRAAAAPGPWPLAPGLAGLPGGWGAWAGLECGGEGRGGWRGALLGRCRVAGRARAPAPRPAHCAARRRLHLPPRRRPAPSARLSEAAEGRQP